MNNFRFAFLLFPLLLGSTTLAADRSPLDSVAEEYVKLALAVGQYQQDYIDAYFGPPEWEPEPLTDTAASFPYEILHQRAVDLLNQLAGPDLDNLSPSQTLRRHYLEAHIRAVQTMISIIQGDKLTFDEESLGLYDAVLPYHDSLYFGSAMSKLDHILPGAGDIAARYLSYVERFNLPHEKLDTVVKIAIAECKKRVREHIDLPEGEDFRVEFVDHRPWGAYNWYHGNSISLIQIDTTRDIALPSLIGIAAHEGYPGHHVYNVLTDKVQYHDSGWVEYCVQPLFGPASLTGEGEANYAPELVFAGVERARFLKSVLFPLAGFDTSEVDRYLEVAHLSRVMNEAWTDAARAYLDGKRNKEQTISWLLRYSGSSRDGAENSIEFYDEYRSYVITYVIGEDLVRRYVESDGGRDDEGTRWERFLRIIESPVTASDLVKPAF